MNSAIYNGGKGYSSIRFNLAESELVKSAELENFDDEGVSCDWHHCNGLLWECERERFPPFSALVVTKTYSPVTGRMLGGCEKLKVASLKGSRLLLND